MGNSNKHAPLSKENILKELFQEYRLSAEPIIIEFPMFSKFTKTIAHFSQYGNVIVMRADDFEALIDDLPYDNQQKIKNQLRSHVNKMSTLQSPNNGHRIKTIHEITNTLPNKPNTQNYQKKQLFSNIPKPFKIKNNYKNQNRRTIQQPYKRKK